MSGAVDRKACLEELLRVSVRASEKILAIYATDFGVDWKGEADPVTAADREANALLCDAIERSFPGVPIVAEESDAASFAGYRDARECFFVDPIDGTWEFIAKNDQFCVMVGLAESHRATLGVLHSPVGGRVVAGGDGIPAFRADPHGDRVPVHVTATSRISDAEFVTSRSHAAPIVDRMMEDLKPRLRTPWGSSGLKGARVAQGLADVYLHPGKAGKRWDACAAEAVVRAAGGEMTDVWGAPFDYRASDLSNFGGMLASNGRLHEELVSRLAKYRAELGHA
ncbi:MAG: 3'(2'),5'-bisphosphate nucleotidase CysQ [Polyangiaceae bacterium]